MSYSEIITLGFLMLIAALSLSNRRTSRLKQDPVPKVSYESSKAVESVQTNNSKVPEMFSKFEVEAKFGKDTWERKAYEAFSAKLSDRNKVFPCIYASKGLKENDLAFLFLPSEDISERRNVLTVARAILKYVPESHSYGLNTSLVILTPNSPKTRSIEDYHKLFWTLLKGLRQIDPKPWPSHISEETDNERWCFCFDGKPAFLAVFTPAHKERQTRYLPYFCFVYQPRWVFEILLSTDAKRDSALNTVRDLIDKYDYPLAHSPDIANFGTVGSSEAKEYYIWDENRPANAPWPTLQAP